MNKTIIKLILTVVIINLSSFAYARDSIKVAGKEVSVQDINLTTDFYIKGNSSAAELYYTFYLDQRDIKIANAYKDRFLKSNSSYKVMSAIILLYVEKVFKNYPCVGKNKCVKNIYVSVKDFFSFLNSNPELRTKFLKARTSTTLFSSKFKRIDEFLFYVARDVGYAFYGISYMNTSSIYARTLLDKMIYSIRSHGNSGRI